MNPSHAAPLRADSNPAERLEDIGSPAWLGAYDQRSDAQTTAEPAAAQRPETNGPLGPASLGRTALGLAVVIAVIFLCSALLKRFGPYKRLAGQSLKIVASQSVGQRERVVVVEVDDTWLVLGVAPNSVNTLHKLPAKRDSADAGESAGTGRAPSHVTPSFGEAFSENLRRATSRFTGRR